MTCRPNAARSMFLHGPQVKNGLSIYKALWKRKQRRKKKEVKEYVAKTICSPQSLIYLLPVLYRERSSMFFSTPVKS